MGLPYADQLEWFGGSIDRHIWQSHGVYGIRYRLILLRCLLIRELSPIGTESPRKPPRPARALGPLITREEEVSDLESNCKTLINQ